MMLPTIKIQLGSDGDYAVINKSDFDPKKHKVYAANVDEKKTKGGEQEFTKEGFMAMSKKDLLPILESHGSSTEGSLSDLRKRAIEVVFLNEE